MQFYFSKKISIISFILVLLMIRASYWQYERYQWKLGLIKEMENNLNIPPTSLDEIKAIYDKNPELIIHRRVEVSGVYDFEHEIVIRNRRFKDEPGVFVITPLKVSSSSSSYYILVNRGFLPLSKSTKEKRQIYRMPTEEVRLVGLVKESSTPKFLAPGDPVTGKDLPWADSWERVNIEGINRQIPYQLLPFYIEIMAIGDKNGIALPSNEEVAEKMIDTRAGKEELLILPMRGHFGGPTTFKDSELPIPVFDTYIPPGRHYGYIFEWAIMAIATFSIALGLQFRKPRPKLPS